MAFHREKFISHGGPSGGNGGPGGSVYLRPNAALQTLSSIDRKVRAQAGNSGKGGWMHGKGGEDVVIDVPVGTVVKEIRKEREEELSRRPPKPSDLEGEDPEAAKQRRSRLFVHCAFLCSHCTPFVQSSDLLCNKTPSSRTKIRRTQCFTSSKST